MAPSLHSCVGLLTPPRRCAMGRRPQARSIKQAIGAPAFRRREVDRKHAPEQLARSLRSPDDSGFFGVGQDGAVAFCFAFDGGDTMERVAAAKENEIPGL